VNRDLLEKVLRSPRLPSLPAIALEVINLAQQDVGMNRIAETLQRDPALSSKILKIANSPFYGQSQTIGTISRALVVLGLNSVKTLALGFSLVATLKHPGKTDFDYVGYWRRSLYTATAARILSQNVRTARREEAFLGGLLQDVGVVAMSQALGDQYAALVQQVGSDHASLRGLEQKALGLDHSEVGAALAEAWNLPPLLVAPIRYHESPGAAGEDILPLVRTVSLGNRVAEIFLSEEGRGGALGTYHTQVGEWFDSPRDQADSMLMEIHQQTDEMGRLFDLPTGPLGNADEILSSANEALMQITLESQQRNQQLADEVKTDPLTAALNRRAFDAFVSDSFRAATESRPVSVLFLDVDHFKTFNDSHGHAVGDRVLKVFAATLKEAVGDRGEVFRYGGEEFTIVCPDTDVEAAAMVAEDARYAVVAGARVRKRNCDQELCITCSVGVATHDGGTFDSVESLIKAADQGVYAAKLAGRNCVRVHSPGEVRELSTVPAR
jgi:diguanylate cyclase (GGDEF)-like protein